jgi:L-threonylcarbamoyladenylate synthase
MHNTGMTIPDRHDPFILDVSEAVALLRAGGVIAIPTDTVYGIAALFDHGDAVERLFAIKGRETTKAIPLLVSEPAILDRLAATVPAAARTLSEQVWPGPLTIVVLASALVPEVVRRGLPTVGVRMPDDPLALEIIRESGGVLAVTSANPSGEPEARSVNEVRARLGGLIDGVVDGGPSPMSQPSTVVDMSGDAMRILRAGALDAARIDAILGRMEPD